MIVSGRKQYPRVELTSPGGRGAPRSDAERKGKVRNSYRHACGSRMGIFVRGVVNSDRHSRGRRRITPVFGRPALGGRSRYPLLDWQPGACSHLGAPIGRAINAAQVSAKLV